MINQKWHRISLIFFLIVALLGTLLRAANYFDFSFVFSHIVHAHSHIAFQGWLYTILFVLSVHMFLDDGQIKKSRYVLQLKITIGVLIGTLVSFWIQGYGLYSILFLSLFQGLNYWFIYRFLKDIKLSAMDPFSLSIRFVKTGLFLGLLSTLGPWGIGVLSAKGMQGTEYYNMVIYFFLHFQYNGWFLFVLVGIFFKMLESEGQVYHSKDAQMFYWMFALSVVPAIALSFLGTSFRDVVWLPATMSAVMQVVGLVYFLKFIQRWQFDRWKNSPQWGNTFLFMALLALVVKVILQLASVFPLFMQEAFFNRDTILAYLHLCFIGLLSFAILGILIKNGWLTDRLFVRSGALLLVIGFVLTEVLLVWRDIPFVDHEFWLFVGSSLMALALFLLVIGPKNYGTS